MELTILSDFEMPGLADAIARQGAGARLLGVAADEPLPAHLPGAALLTTALGNPRLEALLAAASGLRWLHVFGTGVDSFPLHLVPPQVTITCSRGASAVPIAEWVLAMMLAFEKQLPQSWISAAPARMWQANLGTLAGRTLGLAGCGGIGAAVASRAAAFGMQVVALARSPRSEPPPGVEMLRTKEELCERADHLVLCLPSTPATRHFIDAAALARMKPGVHLVNVARGALVDQEALRVALDAGRVACASLDVAEPEPLPEGHWLYTHPRVRLSPHISWSAPQAFAALLAGFLDNVGRFARAEALSGIVDREAGY
ncbi:MAG TPA: NAD(P)-dependent oxidoreductase [Pseudomonadales bacterium]|nr:NAD(P)-dependent oxidoreductase [Pseudomonadales bacterium]